MLVLTPFSGPLDGQMGLLDCHLEPLEGSLEPLDGCLVPLDSHLGPFRGHLGLLVATWRWDLEILQVRQQFEASGLPL